MVARELVLGVECVVNVNFFRLFSLLMLLLPLADSFIKFCMVLDDGAKWRGCAEEEDVTDDDG